MDEMVGLFVLAQGEFGARVDAVAPDQWHSPTVDSEWSVGTLVDHLIEEHRWAAPLVGGQTSDEAGQAVAEAGVAEMDRTTAWDSAAAAAAQAFSAPGALDGEVELSRGPTPARRYLAEMIFDLVIHSWDLGTAIGSDRALPEELVAAVYSIVEPLGDLSVVFAGMFAAPVSVADDAPLIDKLIALTGRDPR